MSLEFHQIMSPNVGNLVAMICSRCRRNVIYQPYSESDEAGPRQAPKGWFELEPGDWRCGCILKQRGSDCE